MIPNNYSPNLPRVSQIVEYFFPFEGEDKQRFLYWLQSYQINEEEYMSEASTWGTYIHSKLEEYIESRKLLKVDAYYSWFINSWIDFIEDYWLTDCETEVYISCNDFQGTSDLIAKIDWKKWILDWKTYSLAKKRFWLPIGKYKKPYSKLKKATLQLSLYAYVLWIENIWVVELLEDWYHFHKLELIPKKKINSLLRQFKLSLK